VIGRDRRGSRRQRGAALLDQEACPLVLLDLNSRCIAGGKSCGKFGLERIQGSSVLVGGDLAALLKDREESPHWDSLVLPESRRITPRFEAGALVQGAAGRRKINAKLRAGFLLGRVRLVWPQQIL
jgi:hypothetical protein